MRMRKPCSHLPRVAENANDHPSLFRAFCKSLFFLRCLTLDVVRFGLVTSVFQKVVVLAQPKHWAGRKWNY
jgi:hypothetical protein